MSVPGLKRRVRSDGKIAWYWIAAAVSTNATDYPTKTRRIVADSEEAAEAQAWTFTAELRLWLAEHKPVTPSFAGTVASLIACYQSDEDSPYQGVRENTRRSYDHDLKILKAHVGDTRVRTLTRKDFARWHRNFAAAVTEDGDRRVRRAHGLMTMVRALLSFGVSMRYEGCADAKVVLDEMTFENPKPRRQAMTFDQAKAVVEKALPVARSIALGQAIQFELGLRQIDVIGTWLTAEKSAVGLVYLGRQWTGGITWADLSSAKLAKRTSKTGQEGVWDPREYPLLVAAIAAFPEAERVGPAIIDERSGRPYLPGEYSRRWREIATAAGIPAVVWNMDSRAGAITEADEAGAAPEDIRNFATHASFQTTQRYIRRTGEATDRVAKLRVAHRERDKS